MQVSVVGLFGFFIGALISFMRNRGIGDFLSGAIRASVPSAVLGVAASLIIALFQMALCKPGHKSGWDVPVWSFGIQTVAILIAGGVSVGVASGHITYFTRSKTSRLFGMLGWCLLGALLGAVMCVGAAFDGYFVLGTNDRPIRNAIVGFLGGASVALVWRLISELLQRSKQREDTIV